MVSLNKVKLQAKIFTILSHLSKNGDDISFVPADHKQSRDAVNKEIHVLHVAESGMMWGRRGQAHQHNGSRAWIPHDDGIQFQASVQEFVDLFTSITTISLRKFNSETN